MQRRLSASCSSRVRLEVSTTSGRSRGRDRPQLGDRDLEVGEQLEQEGLELVVGAVDLVDEQDDGAVGLERLEQRAAQQEAPRVQLALVDAALGRAHGHELARVVPVVEGVVDVDALVALQADEPRAGGRGQRLGHLGLAHAGLALDQQRLAQLGGQEDRGGQRAVGEVALLGERLADRVRRCQGAGGGSGRRLFQCPAGEHPRQVALVVRRGVEVARRVGALGRLLGGRRDRVERPCRAARPPRRLARSGVEPMLVRAMRTSSTEPSPAFLTIAQDRRPWPSPRRGG